MPRVPRAASAWDITALLNAAYPKADLAERHLWLVRLMEWLRQPRPARAESTGTAPADRDAERAIPLPVVRLRHLLRLLDQHPEHRAQVQGLLQAFWQEIDAAALFADYGFAPRVQLGSELMSRLRHRLLPGTPETRDLAELFRLLFVPSDGTWLAAIDEGTLTRLTALMAPAGEDHGWRRSMAVAINILVSAVHGGGFSPPLRKRMSVELLSDKPFRQLPSAADSLRRALDEGDHAAALREAHYLRALLDACRRANASITEHLEEFGVSVDIVFEMDQLHARTLRIEQLLECVLSPQPARDLHRLLVELVRVEGELQGIRSLMSRHYSLLARRVAQRNAETGEHYITRDRREYRAMLGRAAGGGLVLGFTTLVKFGLLGLAVSAFWTGLAAGINYSLSFVLIMLLHWTVATKQPAMTAPAMAEQLAKLPYAPGGAANDARAAAALEAFVDRIAQLTRSQAAGIFGNLALCAPVVLALQWGSQQLFGAPLVGVQQAGQTLNALTLLGPSVLFAAFTGVLLFASSFIAGWTENWFVFHRLDSAIAWNPRIVARLGAARAQRWAGWWRRNISGLTSNVSLGMMLGLVPPLAAFFGLPLDVRHVTLSTGQVAAAVGALGWASLNQPLLWWCVAGILATAVLNVTVSFVLAFKLAVRAQGLKARERGAIQAALRRRLTRRPLDFIWPPRAA